MKGLCKKHPWIAVFAVLAALLVLAGFAEGRLSFGPASDLTEVEVSEVCVRNRSITTPDGICDYVELRNPTNRTLHLGGLGLSDNTAAARGALPPSTRLAPGEVLLVALGTDRMDFKLKEGETLTLFDRSGHAFFTLPLPLVQKNTVLVPENGTYVTVAEPSPGYPNTPEGIEAYRVSLQSDCPLRIGELCQDNLSLIDGGDWAELVNPTESACYHSVLWLSDDRADLQRIRIPAGVLKAGEVLLIDLSDPSLGRPFSLKPRETLYLTDENGLFADRVTVLDCAPDVSQGPEGLRDRPTPGYPDTGTGRAEYLKSRTGDLIFSEAMSWNNSLMPGPYGATHDYVELRNCGEEKADLSLFTVSKGADGERFPLGEGTLEPGACLLFFADGDTSRIPEGYGCFPFGLSSSGCTLVLRRGEQIVDVMNLPPLGPDEAFGRDASMEAVPLTEPSPGLPND